MYASNGRDTVSILQTLSSLLALKNRTSATKEDIEWILESGHYAPIYNYTISKGESVGRVHALAVTAGNNGMVIPVEAEISPSSRRISSIRCGGITENETIKKGYQTFTRTSTAKTAVNNTVLKNRLGSELKYDIDINIPGGIPVDGPSAGIAIFLCCYSAITNTPIPNTLALTGEISIKGDVLPVGGVRAKIEAAISAGADMIIIPKANYCSQFEKLDIEVICAENINEILSLVFKKKENKTELAIAEKI